MPAADGDDEVAALRVGLQYSLLHGGQGFIAFVGQCRGQRRGEQRLTSGGQIKRAKPKKKSIKKRQAD